MTDKNQLCIFGLHETNLENKMRLFILINILVNYGIYFLLLASFPLLGGLPDWSSSISLLARLNGKYFFARVANCLHSFLFWLFIENPNKNCLRGCQHGRDSRCAVAAHLLCMFVVDNLLNIILLICRFLVNLFKTVGHRVLELDLLIMIIWAN
jgi:hypothetical protein